MADANLAALLDAAKDEGKLRMINIYFNVDGSCSVTTQGHKNELLRTGNNDSAAKALEAALQGSGRPTVLDVPKDTAPPAASTQSKFSNWDDL